jgi:hypothetical protein
VVAAGAGVGAAVAVAAGADEAASGADSDGATDDGVGTDGTAVGTAGGLLAGAVAPDPGSGSGRTDGVGAASGLGPPATAAGARTRLIAPTTTALLASPALRDGSAFRVLMSPRGP